MIIISGINGAEKLDTIVFVYWFDSSICHLGICLTKLKWGKQLIRVHGCMCKFPEGGSSFAHAWEKGRKSQQWW